MSASLYYKLIISLQQHQILVVVKNNLDDQIVFSKTHDMDPLAPIELQLETFFHSNEILQSSFHDIIVLHNHSMQTIVPKPLFDETKLGNYLQFSTKVYPSDFFDYDELEQIDAVNVFVPFVNYNNFFIDKFGSFTYKHYSTPFIEWALRTNDSNDEKVFACLTAEHIHLLVANKKELLLYNIFEHQAAEDFIYYLLFVYEQLNLDTNQVYLHISGLIEKDDAYYQLAYKYIRHIELADPHLEAQKISADSAFVKNHFIALHI